MSGFTPDILRTLREHGCILVRHGKGDHEIWFSPITKRHFPVDSHIKSRHSANGMLEQAGFQNNSDSHSLIPPLRRLPSDFRKGDHSSRSSSHPNFLFGRFKETLHRTGNGSVFGMDSDLRKKALASRVPLSRPSPENRPFFPPISEDPIPPLTSLTDILVFSGGAIPVKWPNYSHH